MLISHLDILKLRNIESASLSLSSSNLIIGPNGSGKTSILESLYLLSSGKSFRSAQLDTVIQDGTDDLTVHGKLLGKAVGIQRFKNGKVVIRYDAKPLTRVSEVSRLLPVHIVEPNSVAIVEGSPGERRRFLDFTMFHVEHSYLDIHKGFTAALKQRNALLKQPNVSPKEMSYWDTVYVDNAWALNESRKSLFGKVIAPGITHATKDLLGELDITCDYDDGCRYLETKQEFADKISANFSSDVRFKTTQIGPHRADIILKSKGKLAKDYLSRGQKKLLTYGVRLAPAMMLKRDNKNPGVILIDDMPSELDERSVSKVCAYLQELDAQTLLTAVDGSNIQTEIIIETMKPTMFHVEHGQVQRLDS